MTTAAYLGEFEQLLLLAILRSEEHTSELQSQSNLVCRLLLEKKKKNVLDSSLLDASAAAVLQHDERRCLPPAAVADCDADPLRAACVHDQHPRRHTLIAHRC